MTNSPELASSRSQAALDWLLLTQHSNCLLLESLWDAWREGGREGRGGKEGGKGGYWRLDQLVGGCCIPGRMGGGVLAVLSVQLSQFVQNTPLLQHTSILPLQCIY